MPPKQAISYHFFEQARQSNSGGGSPEEQLILNDMTVRGGSIIYLARLNVRPTSH